MKNKDKIARAIALENSSQLSDMVSKYDCKPIVKGYISKYVQKMGSTAGVINILHDSIGAGTGSSSGSKQYISLLRDNIFKITNGGYGTGYENVINFSEKPSDITYGGTYSIGSLGAVKKSLILQVGATITFTRNAKYIDVFYHRLPSNGSLELRLNGNLVKTMDLTGTDTLDQWTLYEGKGFINNNSANADVYELKCINASVEITGLTTLNQTTNADTIYINRMAVSGYITSDFLNSGQLDSILKVGRMMDSNKIGLFILAVGVNNIFSHKATTVAQYKADLTAIVNYLLVNNQLVMLVVPEHADETLFPPPLDTYENYKRVVLDLANNKQLPVIDLSNINFKGLGLYNDGIHPNDNGHLLYSQIFSFELGIPLSVLLPTQQSIESWTNVEDANFVNSWLNFGGSYPQFGYYKDPSASRVSLKGGIKSGTKTQGTAIYTLPAGYRPMYTSFIPVVCSTGIGSVRIQTTGEIDCWNIPDNIYVFFDGVSFRI